MAPEAAVIAKGFRISSYAVGGPSALGVLFFGGSTLLMWLTRPKDMSPSSSPNQAVRLFEDGFRLFGKLFGLIGDAALAVSLILSVVSLAGLLVAAGLFMTARGLGASAWWARCSASGFLLLMALLALLVFLSTRGSTIGWTALVGAGFCAYLTWAVWRAV